MMFQSGQGSMTIIENLLFGPYGNQARILIYQNRTFDIQENVAVMLWSGTNKDKLSEASQLYKMNRCSQSLSDCLKHENYPTWFHSLFKRVKTRIKQDPCIMADAVPCNTDFENKYSAWVNHDQLVKDLLSGVD